MVVPKRPGKDQMRRLEAIYRKAASFIGCTVSPSALHEAGILVTALRQIRTLIDETDEKIASLCKDMPVPAS